MNSQFYFEKLQNSKEYKKFSEKNPKAFLCSGFFVVDKKGQDNKQHFDFYVPESKKLFSFELENNCRLVPIEMIEQKIPEKLEINFDIDFNNVEKLVSEKMEQEKIKNKIEKMLFSLQKIKGKNMLIGTVFISMLGLLKVRIDVEKMKIVLFEKKSFFDMMSIKKKK